MNNDIVLIGFGGHAKSVIDSIEKRRDYHIIGYTDLVPHEEYKGYPYLGSDDTLQECYEKGVRYAFVAIGYMGEGRLRDLLYQKLKKIGFQIPFIIDPSAVLADDVKIGEGTFIGKGSIVNGASEIGNMCIINTGAVIEHENQIGDFTHVSVNSTLCGNVSVGSHCFIGANATIIQNIKIGQESLVGAGSTVLRDVLPNETVYGIVKNQEKGIRIEG